MKVAVVGSRNIYPDTFNRILSGIPAGCSEIISGGANGVDLLAKKAAKNLNIRYVCVRPNYRKFGRLAPLIRNSEIVDRSDCVLAFWDGVSRGTRHAIACCIKRRKPVKIILINTHNKIYQNYS
ncbi:MAG TPA: hypothetical protein VHR42_07510 [Clostridia bacterium]|nr:hypothetical protein [Clostridia bacterium]